MRELLIANEQLLLRTLQYKVNFDLPYRYLFNYLQALRVNRAFAEVAVGVLNDSLTSTLCIEYSPQVIAVAIIFTVSKIVDDNTLGNFLPQQVQWYSVFDTNQALLEGSFSTHPPTDGTHKTLSKQKLL